MRSNLRKQSPHTQRRALMDECLIAFARDLQQLVKPQARRHVIFFDGKHGTVLGNRGGKLAELVEHVGEILVQLDHIREEGDTVAKRGDRLG